MTTTDEGGRLDINNVLVWLNQLAAHDGEAMINLMRLRVACNKAAVVDKRLQPFHSDYGSPLMGLIEVINYLHAGEHIVAPVIDRRGRHVRFELRAASIPDTKKVYRVEIS